jgi:hypothetical protein
MRWIELEVSRIVETVRRTRYNFGVLLLAHRGNALLNLLLTYVPLISGSVAVTAESSESVDAVMMNAPPAVRAGVRQADVANESLHNQNIEVHGPAL